MYADESVATITGSINGVCYLIIAFFVVTNVIPCSYNQICRREVFILRKCSVYVIFCSHQHVTVFTDWICIPHSAGLSGIHITKERSNEDVVLYWKWVVDKVLWRLA